MKPSAKSYIDIRHDEINIIVRLRRHFRSELKKLRALPAPNLRMNWGGAHLRVEYHAKLLNMRDAAKWLEKFLLLVEGPELSSTDSASDGTRTFTCSLQKGAHKLLLALEVSVFTADENPLATCRKVHVGVDTHTYTSTVPRYELVCD